MHPRKSPCECSVTKTPRHSSSSGESGSLIAFLPSFRNSSRQLRESLSSSDCADSLSGNIALPLLQDEQLSSLAGFDTVVYLLPKLAKVLDRRGQGENHHQPEGRLAKPGQPGKNVAQDDQRDRHDLRHHLELPQI